jgi:hypothetical protein
MNVIINGDKLPPPRIIDLNPGDVFETPYGLICMIGVQNSCSKISDGNILVIELASTIKDKEVNKSNRFPCVNGYGPTHEVSRVFKNVNLNLSE